MNKSEKKLNKVALPLLSHQRVILSKLQIAKRRKKLKILVKLPVITITERATLPPIILNLRQKTSYNLSNFVYISDCK